MVNISSGAPFHLRAPILPDSVFGPGKCGQRRVRVHEQMHWCTQKCLDKGVSTGVKLSTHPHQCASDHVVKVDEGCVIVPFATQSH